ncbi:hypothetical protein EJ02DRAFT_250305 [Clathrospora elynae]|uniref:Uncharacterized protein n=1 Tax=Clathrospora elynae TaxID=706981 RepID=A0A6A5TBQ3_9PLEO|nr:hypothetical protein EJ02DRAFT_250305 [Clathrospora elynae]
MIWLSRFLNVVRVRGRYLSSWSWKKQCWDLGLRRFRSFSHFIPSTPETLSLCFCRHCVWVGIAMSGRNFAFSGISPVFLFRNVVRIELLQHLQLLNGKRLISTRNYHPLLGSSTWCRR